MIKKTRFLLLATPIMLFACDGYEMVRTDAFPYGNQRTAGTGVAYVLAKMLPPKIEPKLQAVEPRPAPQPMAAPPPLPSPIAPQPADKIFKDQLMK